MAGIQAILERLLVPDNAVIQQATRDLQAVYRNPEVIPTLCTLLQTSPNPQIRQFAAVLLRKRLVKLWKRLPDSDQNTIKTVLLQCLSQETVRIVFLSVAHLTSVLAKYELPRRRWEELSSFIFQYCHSQHPQQREVGLLLLSSVMETAALDFKQNFQSLFQLLSTALEDPQSKAVPFYALKCLTSMVEYVGEEDAPFFTPLVPKIVDVVKALIEEDGDKACEGMELFDEIVECEVGMVTPHLPGLIQFSLQVASNTLLGDNLRVKALSFLQWLATLKKKSLLKQGLLPSIISTMLNIMATPPSEGEPEEQEVTESQSPISLAAQVLDVLSLHLPPEKILIPVLQCVQPWLERGNGFERAASLFAIAVMVEGCSVYIKDNHLPALLQIIYKGVRDEQRVVRNAALFAIGQFSEHLQPKIAEYSDELLPVLFQLVDHALSAPHEEASALTKIFYALETFCEQLGPQLVPYMPVLMEKLFLALSAPDAHTCIHMRELAISAIGAAANACEADMMPYFSRTVQVLKEYIALPYHQDTVVLQAQAIDTLGMLARSVGVDNFRPMADECVSLGVALMQSEDPDLRRSVYGMLASVSCVLKEGMLNQLDPVVSRILQALQSEDGVTVHYASSEVPFLDFDEEEEENEGGGGGVGREGEGAKSSESSMLDDSQAIEGYTVENAYLEEKEDGCNALAEIAENVGPGFMKYIDDCYREANSLTEHSHEGIRKAAVYAVGQFCRLWYQWLRERGTSDLGEIEYLVNGTMLSLAATARTDCDRHVVGTTLETLESIFKSLKGTEFKITRQACDSILVSLQDILENKAQCSGAEEEETGAQEGEMSEYDSVVVECAGNLMGPLAAIVGGEVMVPALPPLLSPLVDRLKRGSSVADRSFAIGTLAELLDGLGAHSCKLLELYPLFLKTMSDEDDEVCANAVYGMGLLAENRVPEAQSRYPEILQALFSTAQSRTNARVLDNICAAISRMIVAHTQGVPLEKVIPLLLQNMPLKEDMEEVSTVYSCILHLISTNDPVMMANLPSALRAIAQDLPTNNLTPELRSQLVQLLHLLNTHQSDQLRSALPQLSPEHIAILNTALQQ